MSKTPKAFLSDIGRELADGGFVRFVWSTGVATLFLPNGSEWRIDGRTYFAITQSKHLKKASTGSVEAGDLIIEWRI
jgi:hypothetical protein